MTLDPARRQRLELEIHKHQWRSAFPDSKQLYSNFARRYLQYAQHSNRTLPEEYLATVLNVIVDIYEAEFPAELPEIQQDRHLKKLINPEAAYLLFFDTFLNAVCAFTSSFPPEALLPIGIKPTTLSCLLPVFTTDKENFLPEIQSALHELRKPVVEGRAQFETHGIFDWHDLMPYAWYEFDEAKPRFQERDFYESEPIYGDPEERRRWRRDKRDFDQEQRRDKRSFEELDLHFWETHKKRHDKAHKEVRALTLPWQMTFHQSPFFSYVARLVPKIFMPFNIPEKRWFEGTWIVGAKGRGKTTLLRHLILHHLPRASVIILDAKGDVFKSFTRLASIKDRLVIIDPDLEYPPAINPLDIGKNSVEFLAYLFELLDTKMTSNQTALFRMVLTLLERVPGATLQDFREIIQDGWSPKYEQYVRQLEPDEQTFFDKEFSTKIYNDRKPEVLLRLRLLLSNPYLRAMLRSPKTRINIGELMDAGKVICINNTYNPDKLGEEGCEFFGRMIIALVWAAARRRANRPDDKKHPVFFFMDEAHFFIQRDTTIKKIINQCRSQKVAMVFSHQDVKDIENEQTKSALNDCAIKFANSSGEAHELAPRLYTTPEFIKGQKEGSFAVFVTDKTDTAVSVSVPWVHVRPDQALLDHPYIPDHEYHALTITMRARYCAGYEEPRRPHESHVDYDLYWEHTISPHVARDGGERIIQRLKVKIPPNTKHGTKMRLKGVGSLKPDGTKGDIILTIHIRGRETADSGGRKGPAGLNAPDPDEIG